LARILETNSVINMAREKPDKQTQQTVEPKIQGKTISEWMQYAKTNEKWVNLPLLRQENFMFEFVVSPKGLVGFRIRLGRPKNALFLRFRQIEKLANFIKTIYANSRIVKFGQYIDSLTAEEVEEVETEAEIEF